MNRIYVPADEVVRLWNDGRSTEDIAVMLGCSQATVRNRLSGHPGVRRPFSKAKRKPYGGRAAAAASRKYPCIDTGKVMALYQAGWTAKEIAEDIDLRLDPGVVAEIIAKEAGI